MYAPEHATISSRQCSFKGWTEPRVVAPLAPGTQLLNVAAGFAGTDLLIAGIRVTIQPKTPVWPVESRPLLVLNGDGNALGQPDGGYRYFNVRGGTNREGEFHLV